jgi:hypothetical protein
LNFFNQKVHRDFLIFNYTHDLELADSKAHCYQVRCRNIKKYIFTA